MKLNFWIVSIVATVIVIVGGVFLFSRGESQVPNQLSLEAPTSYEYYWSVTCPHCKNVNDFMVGWDGKDKIKIDKYEINESTENRDRFVARGELCEIPRSRLGVPLLITLKGVCLNGDTPIIEHFKGLKFDENFQSPPTPQ